MLGTGLLLFALGCGSEPTENAPKAAAKTSPKAEAPPATPVAAAPVPQATQALALALAKFPAIEPGKPPVPLPASVEFLVPAGEGRPLAHGLRGGPAEQCRSQGDDLPPIPVGSRNY